MGVFLKVCCKFSYVSIANIFLHYDMGMSDGIFFFPFYVEIIFPKYHSLFMS